MVSIEGCPVFSIPAIGLQSMKDYGGRRGGGTSPPSFGRLVNPLSTGGHIIPTTLQPAPPSGIFRPFNGPEYLSASKSQIFWFPFYRFRMLDKSQCLAAERASQNRYISMNPKNLTLCKQTLCDLDLAEVGDSHCLPIGPLILQMRS